jgi:hypothetical protein
MGEEFQPISEKRQKTSDHDYLMFHDGAALVSFVGMHLFRFLPFDHEYYLGLPQH